MASYESKVATRLRNLREKADLNKDEAAERCNRTRKTIYNWEAGIAVPKLLELPVIAQAYGVKTREVIPE